MFRCDFKQERSQTRLKKNKITKTYHHTKEILPKKTPVTKQESEL